MREKDLCVTSVIIDQQDIKHTHSHTINGGQSINSHQGEKLKDGQTPRGKRTQQRTDKGKFDSSRCGKVFCQFGFLQQHMLWQHKVHPSECRARSSVRDGKDEKCRKGKSADMVTKPVKSVIAQKISENKENKKSKTAEDKDDRTAKTTIAADKKKLREILEKVTLAVITLPPVSPFPSRSPSPQPASSTDCPPFSPLRTHAPVTSEFQASEGGTTAPAPQMTTLPPATRGMKRGRHESPGPAASTSSTSAARPRIPHQQSQLRTCTPRSIAGAEVEMARTAAREMHRKLTKETDKPATPIRSWRDIQTSL